MAAGKPEGGAEGRGNEGHVGKLTPITLYCTEGMTIRLIFSFLLLFPFLSRCQDTLDCEEFLSQKIDSRKWASEVSSHKECLQLDSIDLYWFLGPSTMAKLRKGENVHMENAPNVTYGYMLDKIIAFKNTEEYKERRKFISGLLSGKTPIENEWGPLVENFEIDTLDVSTTYEAVLKKSAELKKPVLLYFTGYGCVNCRKMELGVLIDSNIRALLDTAFISYCLVVDDRTKLPPEKQYFSSVLDRQVTTIGRKNSELQAEKFNIMAQPYFVIVDAKGELLSNSLGYTNQKKEFIDFLQTGLKKFRN